MEPVVSVALIAYQHGPWIRRAIDSVLGQQTRFPFEVVIGEDGSRDGTLEACLEAERAHPDRVKVHTYDGHQKISVRGQLTGRVNIARTLDRCRGKYIALLEGDDWWTRPDKLDLQVRFLEDHPRYSMCCTLADLVDTSGAWLGPRPKTLMREITPERLLTRNFVTTATTLMRRDAMPLPMPDWLMRHSPVTDWPLYLLTLRSGPGRLLPVRTAAYQVGAGTWTSRPRVDTLADEVFLLELYLEHLGMPEQVRPVLARKRMALARAQAASGALDAARSTWEQSRADAPLGLERIFTRTALRMPGVVEALSTARRQARGEVSRRVGQLMNLGWRRS